MPTRPSQEKIEAAAQFLKKEIDPKATLERIIESDPTVTNFLVERGLVQVVESDTDGESFNSN